MRNRDFKMLQEAYVTVLVNEASEEEMHRAYELLRGHARKTGIPENRNIELIEEIQAFLKKGNALGGPKFASFFYAAETTGSKAKYLVNLGTNYANVKQQSIDKISAHVDTLPDDHPDRLAAQRAFTRNVNYFYRLNLGQGVYVGIKWPDLKQFANDLPEGVKPINLAGASPDARRKWFERNPNFNSDEFINNHPELLRIYISGDVQKVTDVVQNRQTPVSQGEVSRLHRDIGTRQNKYKTFILNPKNIAGIRIDKNTLMLNDPQMGEPYVETTDEEGSEDAVEGTGENI